MGKYNPRVLVYVIVWPDHSYVIIDQASGYPEKTDCWYAAKLWTSLVEVKRYLKSFPNEGFKIEQILPSFIPE